MPKQGVKKAFFYFLMQKVTIVFIKNVARKEKSKYYLYYYLKHGQLKIFVDELTFYITFRWWPVLIT